MAPHNLTWMKYPSQSQDSLSSIKDNIFSQNVISRFMHGYIMVFVPAGLVAAIVILGIFTKHFIQHTFEKLDILLFAYTISNTFIILLSLTVTTRPHYLKVSYLECGTLSFFFNLNYCSSQYLLCLMALTVLINKHPPRNALISKVPQNPVASTGFILISAFCTALIFVALLGVENYHDETDCQLDPLFAWPEYEIIKFLFGFSLPSLAKFVCFVLRFVKGTQSEARPSRLNVYSFWTVLAISITMFAFRLFYNVMIACRAGLKMQGRIGTPHNELTMNIAEVLVYGESCISLVIILFLHQPCRSGFLSIVAKLTNVCRRRPSSNRPLEIPEMGTEAAPMQSENGSR